MAEDSQNNALSATFPAPPPFYKHFTTRNLNRLKELEAKAEQLHSAEQDQKDGQEASQTTTFKGDPTRPQGTRLDASELPPDLRYLVPPEPPQDGKYRVLGDSYDNNAPLPTLRDQGVEQLYSDPSSPTTDRAVALKRLTRSLLLNYLALISLLSHSPSAYSPKIDHLSTIFINVHHLINEYRPHQARETLILIMEEWVRKGRREVDDVKKMGEKVEAVLKKVGGLGTEAAAELEGLKVHLEDSGGATSSHASNIDGEDGVDSSWQRDVWQALEEQQPAEQRTNRT